MRVPATVFLVLLVIAVSPVVSPQSSDEAEPSYSRKGADSCLACHEDLVTLGIFKTVHGTPNDPHSPFGQDQLQCEACHGPGGAHAGRVRRGQERPPTGTFGSNALTPIAEQNQACVSCHADNKDKGSSAHKDISCADCHTSHTSRDSVTVTAGQSEVCYGCHVEQRTATLKPYTHPLDQGKMTCDGCHRVHDGEGEYQLARPTLNQTCYQCHADKRGPFVWEHAPVNEDCSVCHDSHGSNHPGMLSQRGPFLCQACHSQSGHPSIANTNDGLANSMPSQFLLGQNCLNCHSQVHGSNHPSGSRLMR